MVDKDFESSLEDKGMFKKLSHLSSIFIAVGGYIPCQVAFGEDAENIAPLSEHVVATCGTLQGLRLCVAP